MLSRLAIGSLALASALCCALPQTAHSEPSLAQLLGAPQARPDAGEQLASQLAALEKRPLARFGAPALGEARAALNSLAALQADHASPERIERRKQLVWAALLLADRLIARAELSASLHVIELRVREAEADAARAEQAASPAGAER